MGAVSRDVIIANIAEDFVTTFKEDPYSSIHVADFLIAAERAHDVLSIIERDPQAIAIGDPIIRRQTQVRRLKLSLATCCEDGSTIDALKTILISAEAEHDDSTLKEVLEKELDLSVEFAGASLRRTVLRDPDRVEDHGSFLAQDAVRSVRAGDSVTAREQLYFHEAWLGRRRDIVEEELSDWTITDHDIAARVETILELDGPKAAFDELARWSPRDVPIRVASILIPQLAAAGKVHYIKSLLEVCPLAGPWGLLLLVPLAMMGEPVDKAAIQALLKRIRRCLIPNPGHHTNSYGDEGWEGALLDTFILACELAFKLGVDRKDVLGAVSLIIGVLEGGKKQRLYSFDVFRFDGLLRCWLLERALSNEAADIGDFVEYVKFLPPLPAPEKQHHSKGRKNKADVTQRKKLEEDRLNKLNTKIRGLFPVYSARIEILTCAKKKEPITDEQLKGLGSVALNSYDFDHDYDNVHFRNKAAQAVMGLLIVDGVEAKDLVIRASSLVKGRYGDLFTIHRLRLWKKMLYRQEEASHLVVLVAKASKEIKTLREPSSEKIEAIINLSRLVLPVSRDDSEALFTDAIGIAKEIDREAFDQIDFVSVLSERARVSEKDDRKTIAAKIFTFVSGAAERLSDHDGFPWRAAVHALTCVDDATSLAAICRWADVNFANLDETLDRFLLTALKRGIIDLETSVSLAVLIGGAHGDLRKELLSRAAVDEQKFTGIFEVLAKETLLLTCQHERLALGQRIVDQATDCSGGPWLKRLRDLLAFLPSITDRKTEDSIVVQSDSMPRLAKDSNPKKEFEFETQGVSFTTPGAIIEVLQEAKEFGLRHHDSTLLRRMRGASSSPRDRIPFLNALAGIPDDSIWPPDRIEMISETLEEWKGAPSVVRWCKETLPTVLVENFYYATRWLKEGQSVLHLLLDSTGQDADGRLQIILAGVAQSGEALSSRTLFAIAEEIARVLDEDDAGEQLSWYTQRLVDRLPSEDQSLYMPTDIPVDTTKAIARFLFALMSDIDTRVRWRASHTLRRLAELRCFDIVNATVSQVDRTEDVDFRDPTAPFYFLAAQLWLVIALCRISNETPMALSSCKLEIIDLATSAKLPHVGIREYAKRTILQLASSGTIELLSSEKEEIDRINIDLKGKFPQEKKHYRSFNMVRDTKRRFQFDEMDTLRYWYDDILDIFPTVSQEKVLEIAEKWIVDNWGGDSESKWWDKEPRKNRYNERQYNLWSNRHGSFPIIERYGTYLEWNAMYCIVGELLENHPIIDETEGNYGSFSYWLKKILPTNPPEWISDNRGPTPLESRLWQIDPRTDHGWLYNIRRDEVLAEIGVQRPTREGWIVVKGYTSSYSPKREMNVQISSALVSPKTAPALVRALQTASNPWDFGLPDEHDDLKIDVPYHQLLGWIATFDGDMRFDANDPFRYEVGYIRAKPGRKLIEAFNLVPQENNPRAWVCNDTNEVTFIYEAWCDEPPREEDYYPQGIRSDGWRLWAKADVVQSFLVKGGWDLICEVQVDRRLRNEYGRSYDKDEKSKKHEKILHLRRDGFINDIKGCIGSWTSTGRGAKP